MAFEIARRLSQSGDEVGLVGLFDTTMSPVRWPLRAWLSIIARRAARLAAALRAAPIRTWPATLHTSAERLRAWRGALGAAPSIAIRVAARGLIASAKYHPGFYRGQLTLFSPAGREPGLPSLESVWRKHARTVVVVETAGTHATMLSTLHAETTAACLTRCLPAENPVRPDNGQWSCAGSSFGAETRALATTRTCGKRFQPVIVEMADVRTFSASCEHQFPQSGTRIGLSWRQRPILHTVVGG